MFSNNNSISSVTSSSCTGKLPGSKAQYNFTQWACKEKWVAWRRERPFNFSSCCIFGTFNTFQLEKDKINEAFYGKIYWQIVLNTQLIISLQKLLNYLFLYRLTLFFNKEEQIIWTIYPVMFLLYISQNINNERKRESF